LLVVNKFLSLALSLSLSRWTLATLL